MLCRSLLTLLSVPRTLGRRRFAPPDGRVSPTGHRGCPWEAQAFSRVLACTRSSRDAWLRKSHAASRRLALGLPSSRCGVCCPRAALASMHASRAALRMTVPILVVKVHHRTATQKKNHTPHGPSLQIVLLFAHVRYRLSTTNSST